MHNPERVSEISEILNSLFDVLNQMGGEQDVKIALEHVIHSQHRTLQQNFMRNLIVPSIQIFANMGEEGWTDLRNEASCKLAGKLHKIANETGLPFV
jgi:hypothetical protein